MPIACGGVLVVPGDWIVADRDGVIVLPAMLIREVTERAKELAREEAFSDALLRAGHPLKVAYPLQHALRPFLSRFCADGSLPSVDEVQQALK